MKKKQYPAPLVFGLDIGTRSIVGTVGYKDKDKFVVVAQAVKEHETRAMLDGQIHDIGKVAETITEVKERLESILDGKLKDVCIAAAGRVLRTVTVQADYEFASETVITNEHIYSLDMLGVEKAYDVLREQTKDENINFYCVGYSVVRYYQNGYAISNLESHKASKISAEVLATFLPEEVVDGLYTAVEKAGLFVANMTLEPIAAINVAIPEKYRLLNIALVDVGAGTSDISITKDGSIIAYGMIPSAGDELTEELAKYYLTDFATAEQIKRDCSEKEIVTYEDIMGLTMEVPSKEVLGVLENTISTMTKSIADQIIELNAGKPVNAVFIVGGGGKVKGFDNKLAEYLGIADTRVALRGKEVLGKVEFLQKEIEKDSLLVTPVGICLNYYEQRNNFIFVNVNKERVKLYDNSRLTIVDAALQVGYPNEALFPRRGKALHYTLNGQSRMVRGEAGDSAVVKLNGREVGISSPIASNDKIEITESTVGKDATLEIGKLPEYRSTIRFHFNGKNIVCPKFVMVNGELVSEYYNIQESDVIEILEYYTLEQVLEFMDILYRDKIYVNNVLADLDEKIYDNFSIHCRIKEEEPNYAELIADYGEQQVPPAVQFAPESILQEDSLREDDTEEEVAEWDDAEEDVLEDSAEQETTEGEDIPEGDVKEGENIPEDDVKEAEAEGVPENAIETATETEGLPEDATETATEAEGLQENAAKEVSEEESKQENAGEGQQGIIALHITVNEDAVTLTGKEKYILVDVLDFYPFDLSVAKGDRLVTTINNIQSDFTAPLKAQDAVKIYWEG